MAKCEDCIHVEVCAYVSHNLPVCDSFAIETPPVKHGYWKLIKKPYKTISGTTETSIAGVKCSVCGFEPWWWDFDVWLEFREKYCPNCGAQMDGGID